jgi:hypothetical protein
VPNPERLKMLQAIIDRMGRNSFACKSWSVTVIAALVGLAAKDTDRRFSVVALYSIVAFAILDTRYLALERAYRGTYEQAAAEAGDSNWQLNTSTIRLVDQMKAIGSVSVWPLYGLELAVTLASLIVQH